MLCYRCGTHVPDGTETCPSCGQKLAFTARSAGAAAPRRAGRAPDGAPAAVGEVVAGRYEITGSIGSGPVGWVFRAQDKEIEVPVALKVLTPRLLQTPDERKEFFAAMRAARRLAHPNIVRLYDEGEDGERPFFTMQGIEGVSLRKVIDMRRDKGVLFALREVLPLFEQLAGALDYAHGTLAHGNLKPENVLVLPEALKISDFGLAQVLPRQPFVAAQRQAGAQHYLAPEVVAGERIEPRADIFSLGVIFGEMLAGRVYDGQTHLDACALNPALPRSADAAFQRAVNAKPAARYASAGAFYQELKAVAQEAGDRAAVVSARPPPPPEPEEVEAEEVVEVQPPPKDIHLQVTREAPAYRPDIHEANTVEFKLPDHLVAKGQEVARPPPAPPPAEARPHRPVLSKAEGTPPRPPPPVPDVHDMATRQIPALPDPSAGLRGADDAIRVGPTPVVASHTPRRPPPAAVSPAASGRPPQRPAARPEVSKAPVYGAVAALLLIGGGVLAWRWHAQELKRERERAQEEMMEKLRAAQPQGAAPAPETPAVAPPAPPPEPEPPAASPPAEPKALEAEKARLAAEQKAAAEKRAADERAASDAEKKRLAAEQKAAVDADKKRLAEEKAQAAAEKKRQAAEERAQAEADRKARAAEAKAAAEAERKSREEARRQEDEKKKEEARLAADSKKKAAEEAAAKKKKEEEARAAEEAKKKADEEAKKKDEAAVVAAAAATDKKCPPGMKWIPPGTFSIGSAANDPMRNFGEKNVAQVNVEGFCMDLYEFPNKAKAAPKANVSWTGAKSTCEKLGKRLCTEEEWEKACKGPGGVRFPYGNDFDPAACNTEDAEGNDRPVSQTGTFAGCKSGYGVFDLAGNVAEWTQSEFAEGSGERTHKGGAANRPDWDTRCATRGSKAPAVANQFLGFRCCWSP